METVTFYLTVPMYLVAVIAILLAILLSLLIANLPWIWRTMQDLLSLVRDRDKINELSESCWKFNETTADLQHQLDDLKRRLEDLERKQ